MCTPEQGGWQLAAHSACESAELLTLGVACHLRERKRGAEGKEVAKLMTEGRVSGCRVGEVVNYVLSTSDGCS